MTTTPNSPQISTPEANAEGMVAPGQENILRSTSRNNNSRAILNCWLASSATRTSCLKATKNCSASWVSKTRLQNSNKTSRATPRNKLSRFTAKRLSTHCRPKASTWLR